MGTLECQKKPSVASSFHRLLPTFVPSRQRSLVRARRPCHTFRDDGRMARKQKGISGFAGNLDSGSRWEPFLFVGPVDAPVKCAGFHSIRRALAIHRYRNAARQGLAGRVVCTILTPVLLPSITCVNLRGLCTQPIRMTKVLRVSCEMGPANDVWRRRILLCTDRCLGEEQIGVSH